MQINHNEVLSPLYSTPKGYEAETIYGLFQSFSTWKEKARKELDAWLADFRNEEKEN